MSVDKDKVSTTNKEFRYIQNREATVKPHYIVPSQHKQYFDEREIICGMYFFVLV
jgi:hypothetical protein